MAKSTETAEEAVEPEENEGETLENQPEAVKDDSQPVEGDEAEPAPSPVPSTEEPDPAAIRSAHRRAVRAGLSDAVLDRYEKNPEMLNDLAEQAETFATQRQQPASSRTAPNPADDFKVEDFPDFDEEKFEEDSRPQAKAMNLAKKAIKHVLARVKAAEERNDALEQAHHDTKVWHFFQDRVRAMPDAPDIYGDGSPHDQKPGSETDLNRRKLFGEYQRIAKKTGDFSQASMDAAHQSLFAARAQLKAKQEKQKKQVINSPTQRRSSSSTAASSKNGKTREEALNDIEAILNA